MKRFIAALFLVLVASVCFGSTINLQWDDTNTGTIVGYHLYQQVGTAAYVLVQTIPKGTLKATATIDNTKSYNFAVTAYNSTGQESAYSNVVNIPVLPAAPTNLRSIMIIVSP